MSIARTFWVTGATQGLGLALVERLLEQGHRVAASVNSLQALQALQERYGVNLLCLAGQLQEIDQASNAIEAFKQRWSTLDGLIINAGTCDYLPAEVNDTDLFETVVSSNLRATDNSLACALPLLAQGDKPQVMAILSRYSALQLHEPNQPLNGTNSPLHWLREQRHALQALGIDLTIVAPQSLKSPVTLAQAIPEQWTAQTTALELVARLDQRQPELVLEALSLNSLWPLPR